MFTKSIIKRGYCTSPSSKKIEMSDRLKIIFKELDLNPVYVFENLELEDTRKKNIKRYQKFKRYIYDS